eukprot:scaffold22379_cov145-Isochrysis_galbana.AAC.5
MSRAAGAGMGLSFRTCSTGSAFVEGFAAFGDVSASVFGLKRLVEFFCRFFLLEGARVCDVVGLAARRLALLSLSRNCAVVALACIHGRAWPCVSGGNCA